MSTLELQLYEQQADFVYHRARNLGFVAGIGSGKSMAGSVRALLAGLGEIGDERVPTPNVGVITAPTFPMLRDATLRTFNDVAGPFIKRFHKSEMIAELKNGSEVFFRSASDPDKLRGPNILWWFGDEAALYGHNVWKIMIGRTRQFGMNGWRWLTTTPRGRNWVWKEFVGRGLDERNRALINVPTWANPFLAEDFVRDLLESYDADTIAQELEGQFLANEGIIYAEFDRDVHMTATLPRGPWQQVVAGVDFGYVNPSVILVGGIGGDGDVSILHEDYRRRRTEEDLVRAAVQIRDALDVETFYCDPSNPAAIRLMQQAGLRAVPADNRVDHGISTVKQLLKRTSAGRTRLRMHADCVYLASEMEQYEWMSNKDGLRDQPKKSNDHACDALRYLCVGVAQRGGGIVVETERWA